MRLPPGSPIKDAGSERSGSGRCSFAAAFAIGYPLQGFGESPDAPGSRRLSEAAWKRYCSARPLQTFYIEHFGMTRCRSEGSASDHVEGRITTGIQS